MTEDPVWRADGTSFAFALRVVPATRAVPKAGSAVSGRASPTISVDFSRRASPIALSKIHRQHFQLETRVESGLETPRSRESLPDTSETSSNTELGKFEMRSNVGGEFDEESFPSNSRLLLVLKRPTELGSVNELCEEVMKGSPRFVSSSREFDEIEVILQLDDELFGLLG